MRAMTRLAQKLLKRTRRWPDLLRSLYDSAQAKDFCSAYHQNSALHPIIAQLERAAQFERDDTLQLKLEKLETLLTSISLNCRRIPPSLHLIACSKPSKRMHAARDRTTQGHTIKGYLTVVAAANIVVSRRQNGHEDLTHGACVLPVCPTIWSIIRVVEKVLVERFEIFCKTQDLKTIAITYGPDL